MFQCMGVRDGVSLYKPLNLSTYLDYKHVHIHMHMAKALLVRHVR